MINSNLSKVKHAIAATLSLVLSGAALAAEGPKVVSGNDAAVINTPNAVVVDTSKPIVAVDSTKPEKPAVVVNSTTWGGLGWGIGVAANFDTGGSRVVTATTINDIVRITDASSNVNVGFVLEAHYFLRTFDFSNEPGMRRVKDCRTIIDVFCLEVAHGPFVAIEVGGGTTNAPAAPSTTNPITAYALGWMVGLRHPNFTVSPNSSWNLGLGVRVDPNARVLGDGIVANQPLPAGEVKDPVRTKQSPRVGLMLVSSFSF
jgi:hypothetical protein